MTASTPHSPESSSPPQLDHVVALAKRRGFVYPTSEIYGGLANSYEYGPLGAQLLKNIKDSWWKFFIENREDVVGLDSQILQHPTTWEASGHVSSFSDPLVTDTKTGKRYRADHLIESWVENHPESVDTNNSIENMTAEEMNSYIQSNNILSPDKNSVSEVKTFNLLFETKIGTVEGEKSTVYLRGETAQGIFANFRQIIDSTRVTLPFGVGQMGKSFRNEITTGQFVFRTLEFEQAEIEYFFDPASSAWEGLFESWKTNMWSFVTENLGINENNLRWRQHSDAERSFYSKETYDLDYHFSFGWKELWGLAYRTDYDLSQHQKFSKTSLEFTDPHTGKKILPHVIEPAVGLNRLFLMILTDAYRVDETKNRTVLSIKPDLSPYHVAIFPLLKNKPELVARAREVFTTLQKHFRVIWDDRGNIGKRYLSQDEIGTPYCITIDFDSLEKSTVTVRDRDTTNQITIQIDDIVSHLQSSINK
ncbi:MAG: glycine--tRNA ligase [Microgenomates group bacterium]